MKATGIVRRIDSLGRIVIPREIRKNNNWIEGTPMDIYTDGEAVVLKEYEPFCTFCGKSEELTDYMGKRVCAECRKNLR